MTIGDPRLKAPTVPVADPAEAGDLLATMVAGLRSLNRAGLAGPQLGASVKVVVVGSVGPTCSPTGRNARSS